MRRSTGRKRAREAKANYSESDKSRAFSIEFCSSERPEAPPDAIEECMRLTLRLFAAVIILYAALAGGLLWAMYRPPAQFGRIMRHVPMPMMVVFPFKPMWYVARKGNLQVGDAAPDFSLPTADKKSSVAVSSFRGQKPVVLVFGSYT
jgi:hypothetical protein